MQTIRLPEQDIQPVVKGDFTSTPFKAYLNGSDKLAKCVSWYDKSEDLRSYIGCGDIEVKSIEAHKTQPGLMVVKLLKGAAKRPAAGSPQGQAVVGVTPGFASASIGGPRMTPQEYLAFCQEVYADAYRIIASTAAQHLPEGKQDILSDAAVIKSVIETAYNFTGRAVMQLAPIIQIPGADQAVEEGKKSDSEFLSKIEAFIGTLSSRDDSETFRAARDRIEASDKLSLEDKTRLARKITEIELEGD